MFLLEKPPADVSMKPRPKQRAQFSFKPSQEQGRWSATFTSQSGPTSDRRTPWNFVEGSLSQLAGRLPPCLAPFLRHGIMRDTRSAHRLPASNVEMKKRTSVRDPALTTTKR